METKVQIQVTSKRSNKVYNVEFDLNNREEGWYLVEADETINDDTMQFNFTGYWELVRQSFRNRNVGEKFEVVNVNLPSGILKEVRVNGEIMSSEVADALIESFVGEGVYTVQSDLIKGGSIKDYKKGEVEDDMWD